MDSGNSSSMQSSSGGGGGDQEEYDSLADQPISAFFNTNTTTVSSNNAGQTQFESLIANYFNTGWSTDNTLWSATTSKPTDGSSPRPPPPISSEPEPVFFTNPLQQNLTTVSNSANTTSPVCSIPSDKKNGLATTRNPKKRARVSRRAPTTVLTTDTSNFRAMVQEFTGNPSTPFIGLASSSSSPFPRSRFDLLGSSSSSPSSRPFKPFPHRLIPPSTTSHHYLIPPPPSTDYQLLFDTNTQNIANPFLNSQSPHDPITDQSLLCEKSKPSFDQPLSLRTSNGFGQVGMGTNFEGLHNIIVSSSSSLTQITQPTLHITRGDNNSEFENDNNLLRSINGEDQSIVLTSDASRQKNNFSGS